MSTDINALVINHKPINEIELKRLLLIFDHVYIIDPKENNFLIPEGVCSINYGSMRIVQGDYGLFYNGELYENQESELINKFDYAFKKNVLRVMNLRALKFYKKYWLPLRLAYDFDTANEKLLVITKNLIEEKEEHKPRNGILRGLFVQPVGIKLYPDIPHVPEIFSGTNEHSYQVQAFSAIGKIDRGLILAGELGLIRAFVDQDDAKLFIEKSKIAKDNTEEGVNQNFRAINKIDLHNVQYLLHRISQIILPDQVLNAVPIKDLVIARNNTFDKLYKLRRQLLSSIKFLRNHK